MRDFDINNVLNVLMRKLKEHEEQIEALSKEVDKLRGEIQGSERRGGPQRSEALVESAENLKTILVVDDDPNLITTFKMILENVGFRVDTANNGIKALFMANKLHYDLVIIDMNLPDMMGDELTRRIHARNPYMKIIMITGYGNYKDELEKDRQIKRVLMKPIPPEDLVEITKQALTKE
jgi:CheY-like chemotaxis protein